MTSSRDPISGKWSPMKEPSGDTLACTFLLLEMIWSITVPFD